MAQLGGGKESIEVTEKRYRGKAVGFDVDFICEIFLKLAPAIGTINFVRAGAGDLLLKNKDKFFMR
jgi:hypothetical protein